MNRTAKAIADAFMQLLDEKPYSKITVRDIAERCGINRNTFYYHFHDIPELLEVTVKNDADCVINQYARFNEPIDCIMPLFEHCMRHKRAIMHIYRSVKRDVFIDSLNRIAMYAVNEYVNAAAADIADDPYDKDLLIRLYKCVIVGILIDWLESGMDYDLPQAFKRVSSLLNR